MSSSVIAPKKQQTPTFDKQSVFLLVFSVTLCLFSAVIYFFSCRNLQSLQVQIETQGEIIETLRSQINILCAEKFVEKDTLENLVQQRTRRNADNEDGGRRTDDNSRDKNDKKVGKKERNRKNNKRRDDRKSRKKSRRRNRNRRNRQNDRVVEEEEVIVVEKDTVYKGHAIKAIHLNIDSQRSEPGNPRLLTGEAGSIVDYWETSDSSFNDNDNFQYNHNGTVTVNQNGLYQIYSQMTYFDRTGRWSHVVDIGGKPYIKCLMSEWGVDRDPLTKMYYSTAQQCYTSAVAFIKRGDQVSIKSMYPDRNIHGDENLSFWGLIHLS